MSLQLAVKLGAAGTLVAGVPTTYFVWDKYFSLNEVERAVLGENVTLTIDEDAPGAKVSATTSVKVPAEGESSQSYNWECKITASNLSNGDGSKLKTYLQSKLPVTTPPTTEPDKTLKNNNKEKLVRLCSKGRKPIEGTTYKSELGITATKDGDSISDTSLFGPKESTGS